MKTNHTLIIVLLLFATSLVWIACGNSPSEATKEAAPKEEDVVALTAAQAKTAGIVLGAVEQKQISGTIKVNGILDVPPQQLVSISVPFGGFLKSTTLLQGSKVRKGEVIAVIENPEYIQFQQEYLEAKSQLEFSQADYERQQQLSAENVNAQKTLQLAKSNYQTWLAKKNGLQEKLKLININLANLEAGHITSVANVYSPINGFVTEVNVNIGKFVSPTDVLFKIVDTEHLHAELIIFEKDVPKIKIGQKVRFTLANETEERFATVHLIGREISSTDRTIRIHCHLDKEDKDLLPGMYLKAIVETGGATVPALPDEAILDFQGKKYIFIPNKEQPSSSEGNKGEQGQSFRMVEIETGISELSFTEVILPEGWKDSPVVVKGAYSILSKIKNTEEEE